MVAYWYTLLPSLLLAFVPAAWRLIFLVKFGALFLLFGWFSAQRPAEGLVEMYAIGIALLIAVAIGRPLLERWLKRRREQREAQEKSAAP
jgi:hypothetical protein